MNQLWTSVRLVRSLALAIAIGCVAMASTVFAQNADLSVSKAGPATIVADTDAEYTVIITNFSGQSSSGTITLNDSFPAELTFISAATPDGWTCTTPPVAGPNTITCTSSAAIPDEGVLGFSFVFHVAAGLSTGTMVTNSANISSESDPNSENNNTSFTSTVDTAPAGPIAFGDVLISEFRLSGPSGAEDDFIELYCNRDTDCIIGGASLRGFDPVNQVDFSITFPPQTVIPARQYYLVADTRGYSLSSYGFPDIDVATSQPPEPEPPIYFYDNEGLQLVGPDDPFIIDSVGFAGGGNSDQYIEGTGLQRSGGITPSRPPDQYAYVRRRGMATNGLPQDTNDNANDFVLVSVTGTLHPGIVTPPVLGAPGPQGLTSPLTYSNSQVTGALVDPTKSKEEDPNRVRVGSGDSGTLSIRRSLTNNTSETFNYLGFRVIDITTLNSPNVVGEDQAELRLISSTETSADVPSRGGEIPIFGTVLEYDALCPCPPQQPNGGGLNTSVFTNFSNEGSMPPNSTIDVQFLMNVVKSGAYKFYVYVEAGDGRGGIVQVGQSASKAPPPATFVNAHRLSKATNKQTQRTPVLRPVTMPAASPANVPATGTARTTPPPVRSTMTVKSAPTPRVIIINRGMAEGEKKPRKKTRVRRKNSAALKKEAEEKSAAEKPQN